MALGLILLLAAPVFDTFDEPLDPLRWYVGVPGAPRHGVLKIPREGWIVSRGVADERVARLEVVFRHKGGSLEVTFHDAREPLSAPLGEPIVIPRGKGTRTLVVTREGATLDETPLAWKGGLRGTFMLRALKGALEIDEVSVDPRVASPARLTELEKRTVHFATTPLTHRVGEAKYGRVNLTLWDVEVAVLFRRGASSFAALKAPPGGAPVLGALASSGDGNEFAARASGSALAMRDWGDERRNMTNTAFLRYLAEEYAVFTVIQQTQRALNAAIPTRNDLDPLVPLAVIRHSANAHAATALAQTQGAKKALAELRKALGRGAELRRVSGDRLRTAAGVAALAILKAPPAEWPGFTTTPMDRYVTIQQAKDLAR